MPHLLRCPVAPPAPHFLDRFSPPSRCRAWEQQSPLAALFRRCDEDLQRAEAEGASLAEENRQLAALLAEADLERLQGEHAFVAFRAFELPVLLLAVLQHGGLLHDTQLACHMHLWTCRDQQDDG